MLRDGMTALIDRVRLLVNDPAGDGQVFSDQEIQDFLDLHRAHVRYLPLDEAPTYSAGAVGYYDYVTDRGHWEADLVVQDGAYGTLTPASIDLLTGHVHFTVSQTPPVLITGKVYDVYAAAVDLLEAWQAKVALEYNFSAEGQSFQRSQKLGQLAALADTYRKRMGAAGGGMTILNREDMV